MVSKEIYVRPRSKWDLKFMPRRLLTKQELERVKAGGCVFLKGADGCWGVAFYVSESHVVNSFQADTELVAMIEAELRRRAMSAVIERHLVDPTDATKQPTTLARRRSMTV